MDLFVPNLGILPERGVDVYSSSGEFIAPYDCVVIAVALGGGGGGGAVTRSGSNGSGHWGATGGLAGGIGVSKPVLLPVGSLVEVLIGSGGEGAVATRSTGQQGIFFLNGRDGGHTDIQCQGLMFMRALGGPGGTASGDGTHTLADGVSAQGDIAGAFYGGLSSVMAQAGGVSGGGAPAAKGLSALPAMTKGAAVRTRSDTREVFWDTLFPELTLMVGGNSEYFSKQQDNVQGTAGSGGVGAGGGACVTSANASNGSGIAGAGKGGRGHAALIYYPVAGL